MENLRIEITFKSGESVIYTPEDWDDYAYDGKSVIVKKNGAWVGIYNFDFVFCVELKEVQKNEEKGNMDKEIDQ